MDYFEAESVTKDAGQYASPDFYRMQFSDTIALGLRDNPIKILHDIEYHGSDQAKALFEETLKRGYIEQKYDSEKDVVFFDVVDTENSGAPYYFRSHIAMQIAFPELYWDYYQGEHVWTFSHPKMQQLVDLCVSCLTNKQHPSDYYGRHEIESDEPKRGRPKVQKQTKKKDIGFQKWVEACKEYNEQIKVAWNIYLDACKMRKEMEAKAKAWRDAELQRLRAEMSNVSQQYEQGMVEYNKAVDAAKAAHANLKAQGKPKRDECE
jgi:hypothetical protein